MIGQWSHHHSGRREDLGTSGQSRWCLPSWLLSPSLEAGSLWQHLAPFGLSATRGANWWCKLMGQKGQNHRSLQITAQSRPVRLARAKHSFWSVVRSPPGEAG